MWLRFCSGTASSESTAHRKRAAAAAAAAKRAKLTKERKQAVVAALGGALAFEKPKTTGAISEVAYRTGLWPTPDAFTTYLAKQVQTTRPFLERVATGSYQLKCYNYHALDSVDKARVDAALLA